MNNPRQKFKRKLKKPTYQPQRLLVILPQRAKESFIAFISALPNPQFKTRNGNRIASRFHFMTYKFDSIQRKVELALQVEDVEDAWIVYQAKMAHSISPLIRQTRPPESVLASLCVKMLIPLSLDAFSSTTLPQWSCKPVKINHHRIYGNAFRGKKTTSTSQAQKHGWVTWIKRKEECIRVCTTQTGPPSKSYQRRGKS